MRLAALLALTLALSWPLSSPGETAPGSPSAQPGPAPRVQSHDIPDDDDDEEEIPWMLYAMGGGFLFFAAVIYLVISREGRSGKG
jgi:hypothetical protein